MRAARSYEGVVEIAGQSLVVPMEARAGRVLARLRAVTLCARLVYAITAIYAIVFASLASVRFLAYQTQRGDLGNMTQAIWTTLHGEFLEGTTQNGEQMSRLGFHVDPFLALIAPLWWVWSSPLMLVTLEAFAVSAGALPLFWLARKHLGSERSAAFFVVAYLLFPPTQGNAFSVGSGFHPVSIAIPLLLLAIWFLDENRLVAFSLVAVVAATTKEEIPLAIGLLGLWYAVRTRRWRFGLLVLGTGLALTLIDFLVIIPHFLGRSTFFDNQYTAVGGTPGGIFHTLAAHPMVVAHEVATPHKLLYVLLLFGPFLGLSLLEPLLALAAAPDLVINLLSGRPQQTTIGYHYTAGIAPFVVAAAVFGAARLRRHSARAALYTFAVVASMAAISPLYMGVQNLSQALPSNPLHRAKAAALALIPPDAPVSASNQLAGHLSARRRILTFPFAVREARWIALDEADPTYLDESWYQRRIASLKRDRDWRLVYSSHGVLVFRKLNPAPAQ